MGKDERTAPVLGNFLRYVALQYREREYYLTQTPNHEVRDRDLPTNLTAAVIDETLNGLVDSWKQGERTAFSEEMDNSYVE